MSAKRSGPATSHPRLAELDPVEVASEVCGWVVHHVGRITFELGQPAIAWGSTPENTSLGIAVQELTLYAQKGPPHCADAGGPRQYIQSVAEALYSGAHPDVYSSSSDAWPWSELRAEPEHPIEVVMLAANGRERLSGTTRERIPYRELAALGGLSEAMVRKLVASGELRGEGGQVTPASAVRWLGARGVAGFGGR